MADIDHLIVRIESRTTTFERHVQCVMRGTDLRWLDPYFGIPFKNRGRDYTGLDCYGLCKLILEEHASVRIPSLDTLDAYDGRAVRETIERESEHWLRVVPGCERRFDLAIMRGQYQHEGRWLGGEVHVGLVVAPRRLIHVEEGINVTCVPFDHSTVAGRIKRILRHRDLA